MTHKMDHFFKFMEKSEILGAGSCASAKQIRANDQEGIQMTPSLEKAQIFWCSVVQINTQWNLMEPNVQRGISCACWTQTGRFLSGGLVLFWTTAVWVFPEPVINRDHIQLSANDGWNSALFLDHWSHAFRLLGKYDSIIIFLIIPGQSAQGHSRSQSYSVNVWKKRRKKLIDYLAYDDARECGRSDKPWIRAVTSFHFCRII